MKTLLYRIHGLFVKLFQLPVRFYRKCISPNLGRGKCKYLPTCSQYCLEALEEWGIVRGLLLSAWRVLRCNPFSKGGFDPVPQNKKKRK
ncbi:MAG: membrane protein insertion efficiency factor YidD [Clostridia bacterium]|nr:membrane protein insertion efficiency factor YidD [Clostridia bacterium]